VTRFDPSGIFSHGRDLPGEDGGFEDLGADDFVDALRSTMREEYADASDEEMGDALTNLLGSMSPAEAINFASALDRIGTSASELASDPTVAAVAGAALPVLGGAAGTLGSGPAGTAAGTMLGGLAASALPASAAPSAAGATPVAAAPAPSVAGAALPVLGGSAGTAAGTMLGGLAASALPASAAPPAAAATPVAAAPAPSTAMAAPGPPTAAAIPFAAAPEPGSARVTAPVIASPSPRPASEVADGSAAAAQGLVLTQHPDVLRGLLATALGQHGRQQVSGVPVAQVLELLSQVFAQAAADADQLMYLKQAGDAESVFDDVPAGSLRSLYADLLGADNLELAEAAEWDGLDP
jgi:hypothetical protein